MNRIPFLDLETTGLNEDTCVILEAGLIIVDQDLQEVDVYHEVVYQSEEELAKMDDYCWNIHTQSNLVHEVRASTKTLAEVEDEIIRRLDAEFGPDVKPVLAGSSIHFDRKFIRKHMPRLDKRLHYRMIDVSSFKEAYRLLFGYKRPQSAVPSKPAHRAIPDGRESIAELKHYARFVNTRELKLEMLFDSENF